MNSNIQVFTKDNFTARTFTDDNGTIWFVAKDIAQALDYSDASNPARLFANVPEIWKGVKPIHTPGGEQEMLCITEQGLYFFLGRSDKPKALPYQMWIAGDVIPSIMHTGFYATPATAQRILDDPDTFIRILQAYKDQRQRNAELEAQIEQDKPKVLFAESVAVSDKSILVRDLAKLLRQNGYMTGEKRLFAELRTRGFIMKKDAANMPTQKSMELGLMEILERTITKPSGEISCRTTTKITGKGQVYFIDMFLNRN